MRTQGRGRTVDEWKIRPVQFDNHWLDSLVGTAVAASIQGDGLPGAQLHPQRRTERVKLSAIKRGSKR